MIREPFRLHPRMEVVDAMRATMVRHYPVYPVCEDDGRLVGLMRGQMLFEARSVELSLLPGSMVGVEREERLGTSWVRSFRFRHPWLQGNLLAGFFAAAVVGYFQGTINRLVALAVFLPVVIGQSSNTGVQTLAIALRGMTLGELRRGRERALILKETFLGFLNGALTGVSAGVAMYLFASLQGSPECVAAEPGCFSGHDCELPECGNLRRARPAGFAQVRHRSGDGLEYRPEHDQRCRQSRRFSRPGDVADLK